jgi:hypothetical protein
MTTDKQIHRYLRFKHRYVNGLRLCRAMGITPKQLRELEDRVTWMGSFGPIDDGSASPERYARFNGFSASFIHFFRRRRDGRYFCRPDRLIVRGYGKPCKRNPSLAEMSTRRLKNIGSTPCSQRISHETIHH